MQSNNPALNRTDWGRGQRLATFRDISPDELQRSYDSPAFTPVHERTMTVDDVVQRTLAMVGVLGLTGAVAWLLGPVGLVLALPAALIGFVLSLVIIFKQITNPVAILAYAALEGLLLGAVSRLFETAYHGIVLQAVIGTAAVFFGMVFAYTQRWIRATPKFTRWVVGALIGVVVLMVVNLLASLIGGGDGLGLRSGGPIAIGFSLVCIGIAALTFVLDFDGVEKAVAGGAPQRYAWYASFGIVLGLVWLYFEILRLLSYLRN
ncbi:MAG: Bax inhibitor-1/YccA family protein [Actinomycetota bacterium]|nr:Bax inhibitor-1/YccA family protein [Actinomycetota bacterium]